MVGVRILTQFGLDYSQTAVSGQIQDPHKHYKHLIMDNIKHKEIIIDILAKSRYVWLQTAESLFTASQILYRESDVAFNKLYEYLEKAGSASLDMFPEAHTHIVARMLVGMALENLIKGIILQRFPETIFQGVLDKKITNHDLKTLLLKLPEIIISEKETAILDELTQSILWRGRFPLPLRVENFINTPHMENEIMIVQSLFIRLKDKLLEENIAKQEFG